MGKVGFIFIIHNSNWEPLIESLKVLKDNGKYLYFIFVDSDSDFVPDYLRSFNEEIFFKFKKTNNVSFNRNYFIKESINYNVDFLVFNDYDDKYNLSGLKILQSISLENFNTSDVFIFSSSVSKGDRIIGFKSSEDYDFNNFRLLNTCSFSFPHLSSWVFRKDFLIQNKIKFNENLKGSEDTKFLVDVILKKPLISKNNSVLRVIKRHDLNTTKDIYKLDLLKYRILAYGSMCVSLVKNFKFIVAWKAFVVVLKSLSKLIIKLRF